MKIFIIKGVALIFLLILVDSLAGKVFVLFHRKAIEHSPRGMFTEYIMSEAEADVIIVGSSRANHHYVPGILKDSLRLSVYNAGRDGKFFLYQCCIIDGILKRISPRIIIWDMEPFVLSGPIPGELDGLSVLNPFYDSNDYCRKVIRERGVPERYKMMSQLYRYNSRILSLLHQSFKRVDVPEDGYMPLANEGYKYPRLVKNEIPDVLDQGFVEYFTETVKKCRMRGVNLILSFSPQLTVDDYKATQSYRQLCRIAEQEEIPLVDFYHTIEFMSDSALFKDNAHLNDRGARRFTVLFNEKIGQGGNRKEGCGMSGAGR